MLTPCERQKIFRSCCRYKQMHVEGSNHHFYVQKELDFNQIDRQTRSNFKVESIPKSLNYKMGFLNIQKILKKSNIMK